MFCVTALMGYKNKYSKNLKTNISCCYIYDGKRWRPDRVKKPVVKIPVDLVTDF